jgi:tryptophan halogenase
MQNEEQIGPIGPADSSPESIKPNDFNFVIVGGGTAGWMTALFLKKNYPWVNITVLASAEIGILGAGEGTTPHFIQFMDNIGIAVSDIVKYAKGTLKSGIKFTDWNGDDTSYFHPFFENTNINVFEINDAMNGGGVSTIVLDAISKGNSLDDVSFSANSSNKNLVNFVPSLNIENKNSNPINHFNSLSNFGMHFDARLLAKYLKKSAMYQGVRYIESELDQIINNEEDGTIKEITTKRGDKIPCSFVFDCSGFNRLIIGKHFNSEWESYSDSLPMKRALPFIIANESDDVPPYTESIALKYGWMWKIPVEGRFGCGYVFDSDFISDEQAMDEIRERFGTDIEFGKPFTYEAGRYKQTWIKNCIAIGLSAGFIEPLEATSIWTIIASLNEYISNNLGAITQKPFYIDRFNDRVNKFHDDTKDFIYLHYLTKRNDSEFWKTFKDKNKITENIYKFLVQCKMTMPDSKFLRSINNAYDLSSFYSITNGLHLFDTENAAEVLGATNSDIRREYLSSSGINFRTNMLLNLKNLQDHNDFLQYLKM